MVEAPASAPPTVAIIGGGWAGLACALQLAKAGYKPVVFESAPAAGGRARSALIEGVQRDNGQHLMLAGCASLIRLFVAAGIELPTSAFSSQSGARALHVPPNSGTFGLAVALCRAQGFSWMERYRLFAAIVTLQAKNWQVPDAQCVADWLQTTHQPDNLIKTFWAPLALAILNTPLEDAAMRRLAPVLRDTLGMGGRALSILMPAGNLSASIVTPLVNAIEALGGSICCGQRVSAIQQHNPGYEISIQGAPKILHFDQVVLTLPPWSLTQLILPVAIAPEKIAQDFGSQPIATVYLGFEPTFRLPTPLFQIAGPTAADMRIWATDRGYCAEPGVIALSISATGAWCQLSPDALATTCLNALKDAVPELPNCLWKKAVVIQRATYAATPRATISVRDLEPLPHLYLAGDWTHAAYPATLEAAVQSGFRAAERILQQQP